jgi:hypothetical protein
MTVRRALTADGVGVAAPSDGPATRQLGGQPFDRKTDGSSRRRSSALLRRASRPRTELAARSAAAQFPLRYRNEHRDGQHLPKVPRRLRTYQATAHAPMREARLLAYREATGRVLLIDQGMTLERVIDGYDLPNSWR